MTTQLQEAAAYWRCHAGQGALGAFGIVVGTMGLVFTSAVGAGTRVEFESLVGELGDGVAPSRSLHDEMILVDDHRVRIIAKTRAGASTYRPLGNTAPASVAVRDLDGTLRALREEQQMRNLVRTLLGALSALALLLGGTSVTNTMLNNLIHRRHEVALRLALGAMRRDIAVQFVSEALVICVISAGVAILFGTVGIALVGDWAPWPMTLDLWVFGAVVTAALLVAVAAGALPAWRAARILPAEAIG